MTQFEELYAEIDAQPENRLPDVAVTIEGTPNIWRVNGSTTTPDGKSYKLGFAWDNNEGHAVLGKRFAMLAFSLRMSAENGGPL